jgi:hypothetical protein
MTDDRRCKHRSSCWRLQFGIIRNVRGTFLNTGRTCVIMSAGTPMHAILRVARPAGCTFAEGPMDCARRITAEHYHHGFKHCR